VSLNQLYSDHQHQLIEIAQSSTAETRDIHLGVAARIARQIAETQRNLGATAANGWSRHEGCNHLSPADHFAR
jgi:hypothetical protein